MNEESQFGWFGVLLAFLIMSILMFIVASFIFEGGSNLGIVK